MQAQLFGEQLTLSSTFSAQPEPTVAAHQAMQAHSATIHEDIIVEIEEKQERIAELKKEIGDAVEHIATVEEGELDLEPDENEEVIFYAEVPQLEADLEYTRVENEEDIKALEEGIEELEEKLKRG